MRIMHLIDSLEFGGAEQVVVSLSNEQSRNHSVFVCCVKQEGDLSDSLSGSVEIINLNRGEGNNYKLALSVSNIIKEKSIDVLHVHCWGLFVAGAIAKTLSRLGCSVFTVHGTYIEYPSGVASVIKRGIRRLLERVFVGQYTRIVSVSGQLENYIGTALGFRGERLQVIENGIEVGPEPESKIERGKTVLITVGRLHPVKNYKMMIRAVASVIERDENLELWIVGDGDIRGELEDLIKELGVEDNIRLLGFRSDINELLSRSSVFLLSSEYEGISIALLEAMRMGLPAVATRVGGIPETIEEGKTGLLVEDGDTAAFAQAIEKLSGDTELCVSMGYAARQRLIKYFSIDAMVNSYEVIYKGEAS